MTGPNRLQRLESLLEARYGFAPSADLRERLASLANKRPALSAETLPAESPWLREVAETLVVGETYFFRESAQIEYCARTAIPERAGMDTLGHPIRVLSAGCSSGEEAYSLAITLEAYGGDLARRVSIVGVDVSEVAIRKAKAGRYSAWSLRATPAGIRETCFRNRGNDYELDERFRSRVRFEERNLFDADPEFWSPGAFDLVFCRNVTIYFSERAMKDLASRFATMLAPGGLLFLGHSETLRGISDDFDLIHEGDVFYYRRKGFPRQTFLETPRNALESASPPPPSPRVPTPAPPPPPSPPPLPLILPVAPITLPSIEPRVVVDRSQIISLIEEERFDEALSALGGLPRGPHVTLFEAILWVGKGLFREAEKACRTLLATNRFESEAHYLLGLCNEHARLYDVAEKHYRQAGRMDLRFAMPRLRLGLLLKRSGDDVRARIELDAAAELLTSEERIRISLFGGGFSRDVLLDLCRERPAAR